MFSSISKEQFNNYKKKGFNRIPLLVEASSDLDSPLSIFTKLANHPYSYLLESVEGGDNFGRYSIVGLPSKIQIKINKNIISIFENGNLKVEGTIKSTNLDVLGVSTFTRYSGFNANEVNVNNRDLTLSGEYSTTGDIVVEDGASLTVGLGSTACTGSVECISVKHHFSVPVGNTAQRNETSGYGEGTVRYNRDLGTMEFFNGSEWRQFNYQIDIQNSPSTRGRAVFMSNAGGHKLDFVNISSLGNATLFGSLINGYQYGCASETRGLWAGGYNPSTDNSISYITIASEGDSIDFGDLNEARRATAAASSSIRGVWFGGYSPAGGGSSNRTNTIQCVEIQTLGNSTDFGDLTD